jgi:hypothetical protein
MRNRCAGLLVLLDRLDSGGRTTPRSGGSTFVSSPRTRCAAGRQAPRASSCGGVRGGCSKPRGSRREEPRASSRTSRFSFVPSRRSSSLAILRDEERRPVTLGDEAFFSMRIEHAPGSKRPLVFVGYGLTVPEEGHDDLAGLDLKGKVALHFTADPRNIPVLSWRTTSRRGERWKFLEKAGALGVVAIRNPRGQDIPWERAARALPAGDGAHGPRARGSGRTKALSHLPPGERQEALRGKRARLRGLLAAAPSA